MGTFFKSNDFKTGFKKRPNDVYKAALGKLDDETKKKMDRQRPWILVAVIAAVFCLIIVLAMTGVGTNKAEAAGNILEREGTAVINGLGDSLTVGSSFGEDETETNRSESWISFMKTSLEERLGKDIIVNNYGSKELAENTSYKRMDQKGDIVIMLCGLENLLQGQDPEGILEANIDGIVNQGCLVYLVNYPNASFAKEGSAVREANQYISQAAKSKNLLLLDASAYFKGMLEQGNTEGELFQKDGISLTEAGQKLLGTFIAAGLIADAGLE